MSTSPEPSQPDLDALGRKLSAMPLAPAAVSRDQLFFRAGLARGTAQWRRRFAMAATVLTSVALGAGVLVGRWTGPEPMVVEKVIVVHEAPPRPQPPPADPDKQKHANPPAVEQPPKQPPVSIPTESLAGTFREHPLAKDMDALLSDTRPPANPMMMPFSPVSESVEDVLGLPPGSLSETERSRWTTALHMGGKS